ncbi:hypothetical protein, partial [uncultured Selenomonas sp.]|uniref:hypothetical protein n=1 Tax=uncultured Selenomonas sp. TaxID=159275 RepID=UPI0028D8B0D4
GGKDVCARPRLYIHRWFSFFSILLSLCETGVKGNCFTKEEKAYKINIENGNLRWEISPSPRADGVTGKTRVDAGELGACQITMMESRPQGRLLLLRPVYAKIT